MAMAFLAFAAGSHVAPSPAAGRIVAPAVAVAGPALAAPKGGSAAVVAGVLASAGVRGGIRRRSRRAAVRCVGDVDEAGYVDEAKLEGQDGSAAADFVKFRQNYAETPERLLNQQIQMELEASHSYLAMGAFFDRADVALPGFKEWATKQSDEEREHAEKLIKYQNLRGGDYVPMPIAAPAATSWGSALDAMKCALTMEMTVNKSLLKLHRACDAAGDPQFCDFLESEFLAEQVESINEISKVVRKLIRAGPGLGEYTVDKDTQ